MATGFTAGTSLGSQYQYTPITFAPLLSLVPQRQEAPAAPAPTGLEATAQMPVPQNTGGQEGPGGEMQPFSGPMVGQQPFGQVMSDIGKGLSMVMNPLPNLISVITTGKTLMENMGLMFGQQQQQTQQAPVVTITDQAIALSQQMGIPASDAQSLIDPIGLGGAQAATGMADIAESGAAGAGPSGDVGGIGGIGDVSEGSGGASPW
jgi:hypothetical protein